jgi:YYY domain-containing protein
MPWTHIAPMKRLRSSRIFKHVLPALLLFALALTVRLYDLNWDQSQFNHPDERHTTNVLSQLQMPDSLTAYFDSGRSTLNPYNNRQSWVYGTFPIVLYRSAAEWLNTGCAPEPQLLAQWTGRLFFGDEARNCPTNFFVNYDMVRLVGRLISALGDTLTVLAVFLTGRQLFGWRVGLLAALFSAFAVLQIQHAKYAVVDALLTTCTAWCLYFCARLQSMALTPGHKPLALWLNALLAGLFSGLAVASKISGWPTAVMVLVAVGIVLWRDRRAFGIAVIDAALAALLAGTAAFGAFRVAQPYAFVGVSDIEWRITTRNCGPPLEQVQIEICQQTTPMPPVLQTLVTGMPEIIRPVLAPSARWIAELQQAAAGASGDFDPPFGWQWASRAPVTFSLINIVFYGLGLPLGLAAVAGVLFAWRQILRGRRWWAYLVPALWTLGYFLYQSTTYVKSIRYQLPIYPMLCVLAAALLWAGWRWLGQRLMRRRLGDVLARSMAFLPVAAVATGTIVWALAFMRIYDGELTRTEASRWMYQNVPSAVTLSGLENTQPWQTQLPQSLFAVAPGQPPVLIPIRISARVDSLDAPLRGPSFTFNHLDGQATVRGRLVEMMTGVSLGEASRTLRPGASTLTFADVTLNPDTDYQLEVEADASIIARGSVIANQHWDEGIPFRLDGRDGYGQFYRGLSFAGGEMQVYMEEDPYIDDANPGKLELMLRSLDEADYVVLNSNRHYGSVARLPWRFPMTMEYYRALMGGELGFELVADFARFPRLGPFYVNDQEMPQRLLRPDNVAGTLNGLVQVPYPTAEEAFSVYDHPRVLIFRKTPAYTRALAEARLGVFDLTRTVKRTAFQSSRAPGGLLFDDRTREIQEAGGTWRALFPRSSPLNQSQPLAVLAWLALIQAVGLAAWFIWVGLLKHRSSALLPLVDTGYAFSKALGLLLIGFVAWWLASLKWVGFEQQALWIMTGIFGAVGAVVGHLNRQTIFAIVRERWRVLLAAELVFMLSFGVWLLVRIANPDLWHPYRGGEKPMDLAMLNAVLRSTVFPPMDAWFSGGYINYYYWGYVFIGWPIKALGIDPAIAYNLAVPTLFALTAVGAYGVAVNLVGGRAQVDERPGSPSQRRIIVAGVVAALFAVYLGNLKQLDTVGPALRQMGGEASGTPGLIALVSGFGQWLNGATLPIGPDHPYWNATRPSAEVWIAEFPAFTFLYADLHAHMMAMPLALLALGFALAFARGMRGKIAIGLAAVAAGVLWPANTWDYFPYLLLVMGGMVIGRLREHDGRVTFDRIVEAVVAALPGLIGLAALSRLAFVPYLESFGSAYNAVEPWLRDRTAIDTYLSIHGLFMLPIGLALLRTVFFAPVDTAQTRKYGLIALGIAALGTVYFLGRSGNQSTPAWTSLLSIPLTALAFAAAIRPQAARENRLLWLMTGGAFAITVFVEHFVLSGDIERMNTVFKFYIVVWLLLCTAAAACLIDVLAWLRTQPKPAPVHLPEFALDHIPAVREVGSPIPALVAESTPTLAPDPVSTVGEGGLPVPALVPVAAPAPTFALKPVFRLVFSVAMAWLVFLAALYPVFAIRAKIEERFVTSAPVGLDGMRYMRDAELIGFDIEEGDQPYPLQADYEAIRWLQDNVNGSPVILEGTAGGNQYRWAGRFAIYTGLPGVVGWQWHQRQQRGAAFDDRVIYDRFADVETFYSSSEIPVAETILKRYRVRYVVVSAYEKMYYSPIGFSKFPRMAGQGLLREVYRNEHVTLYEVTRAR